jgi:transcription antitermination factor NusG
MHGIIGVPTTPEAIRPEFEDAPLSRRTYLIQSAPQQEMRVCHALRNAGFDAYLPMEPRKIRVNLARFKTMMRPMMPGYVFPIFDEHRDYWERIPQIYGVVRLFMVAMRPVPIPDGAIENIQRREIESKIKGKPINAIPFAIGTWVQVNDFGAWHGFMGEVVGHLAKKEKIIIELNVFGRMSRIELSAQHVRPV